MWLADNWKDYEVIDCSKGEKLERWGDYILVRPDPQVIWDTPRKEKGWHKMNAHYHRSKKGGGEWEFFDLPQQWSIHYRNLTFQLKPFSFKHTGLFPEQAANWDWFSELIKKAGRPVKVSNSWNVKSAVATTTMLLLWTLHPTAEVPRVKFGKSKNPSIHWSNSVHSFWWTDLCSS